MKSLVLSQLSMLAEDNCVLCYRLGVELEFMFENDIAIRTWLLFIASGL